MHGYLVGQVPGVHGDMSFVVARLQQKSLCMITYLICAGLVEHMAYGDTLHGVSRNQ